MCHFSFVVAHFEGSKKNDDRMYAIFTRVEVYGTADDIRARA